MMVASRLIAAQDLETAGASGSGSGIADAIDITSMPSWNATTGANNYAAAIEAQTIAWATKQHIYVPGVLIIVVPSGQTFGIGGLHFFGKDKAVSSLEIRGQTDGNFFCYLYFDSSSFTGLTLKLTNTTPSYLSIFTAVDNATGLLFDDCKIVMNTTSVAAGTSYWLQYTNSSGTSSNTIFRNCIFQMIGGLVLRGNTSNQVVRNFTVENCVFDNCSGWVLGINAPRPNMSFNVNINRNTFNMVTSGSLENVAIDLSGVSGYTINDNYFTGPYYQVLHFEEESTNGSIRGNRGQLSAVSQVIFVTDNNIGTGRTIYPTFRTVCADNIFYYTGSSGTYANALTGSTATGFLSVFNGSGHEAMVSWDVHDNRFINFDCGFYLQSFLEGGTSTRNSFRNNIAEGGVIGWVTRGYSADFTDNKSIGCAYGVNNNNGVYHRHMFRDCTVNIDISANTRAHYFDSKFEYSAPGASATKDLLPANISATRYNGTATITSETNRTHQYAVKFDGTTHTLTADTAMDYNNGTPDATLSYASSTLRAVTNGTGTGPLHVNFAGFIQVAAA